MDQEMVKAIKDWPSPRNVFEVRSFQGNFARFYRKFIRKFSGMCAPILDTVKKEKEPFKWNVATELIIKLKTIARLISSG